MIPDLRYTGAASQFLRRALHASFDIGFSLHPCPRKLGAPHLDECLNEHWFPSLAHTHVLIEAWRCEYNEERPKKRLGWLTPAHYARRLAAKRSTVTVGL